MGWGSKCSITRGEAVMEDKRRFYRMPGKIKASYLSASSDWNGLFCTNISHQGMSISIPYQENLKAGTGKPGTPY